MDEQTERIMGVLSNNKITPEALVSKGFVADGWGSPHIRETKNTTMYEAVVKNKCSYWAIFYFPPEFEGVVAPTGGCIVDMRNTLMMQKQSGSMETNTYILMGPEDLIDIEVFIKQVFRGKIKPFNSYEYSNRTCRSRNK